jgi:hypothetical protein
MLFGISINDQKPRPQIEKVKNKTYDSGNIPDIVRMWHGKKQVGAAAVLAKDFVIEEAPFVAVVYAVLRVCLMLLNTNGIQDVSWRIVGLDYFKAA